MTLIEEFDKIRKEMQAKIDKLQEQLGTHRYCLVCGQRVDATVILPGDDLPRCRGEDGLSACTFDLTPEEAVNVFRSRTIEAENKVKELEKKLAACEAINNV